jgi:hypothetical protein
MLELAEPPEAAESVAVLQKKGEPIWIRGALGFLIAIYLLAMGLWAFKAGMYLREQTWTYTRTIRLEDNVSAGLRWGTSVLRTAERLVNNPPANSHATTKPMQLLAKAAPTPGSKTERPLTLGEILRGEDQLYQDMVVEEPSDANYPLDYPPLRLLAMTMWARHVENTIHVPAVWPGYFVKLSYNVKGDPAALIDENIARPMLLANSYSIAVSALLAFLLVWIWTNRGGRPTLATKSRGWRSWIGPSRQLVPWKLTPLRKINGLAVFAISAPAFFYAMVIAVTAAPPPPPTIAFENRPQLSAGDHGTVSATIFARIHDQGDETKAFAQWGMTPFYDRQTASVTAGDDPIQFKLTGLEPGKLIHYRIIARNSRGTTYTRDETFNTSDALTPLPSRIEYGQVWLSWPLYVGIAILFLAMTISIRYLPPEHRGWAAGLAAACFIWFDPSILMDTHVWPQWDAWVLPPFLLAALLGTLDWWFVAGLVLGVGVMFKGQTMLAAPLLLLWPLLAGRWAAAMRVTTGFILSAGLVLSQWLVLGNIPPQWSVGPLRWIPAVLVAALFAVALSLYRVAIRRNICLAFSQIKQEWSKKTPAGTAAEPGASIWELVVFGVSLLLGIVLITMLVLRRWPSDAEIPRYAGLILLLGILIPPWFLRRRSLGIWLAAILASSLWMSAFLYHGDWSWKTIGFEYGTRRHLEMSLGLGNVPQILQTRFQWDIHDTAITLHPPDLVHALHLKENSWAHNWGLDGTALDVDIRQFLICMFVLVLIATAAGTALQSRRNDPRWLASIAAIWVLMPVVLCQMQARYMIWGVATSSMLIALSPGLTLLHVVLSLLGVGAIASALLHFDASRSPRLMDFMGRFMPDYGWIMLLIGLMFLYISLMPGRRPARAELDLP